MREKESIALVPPENCPVCRQKLLKTETDIDLRCENPQCPAIIEGRLEHFISKKGMNIQTLGNALIRQLIHEKFISDISDVFRLAEMRLDLIKLPGLGEKSVDKILAAIENSKSIPLNQFIYALGIRNIGEKAAKAIATDLSSLNDFMALTEEHLDGLPDFGPIMIESMLKWLKNDHNVRMLKRCLSSGAAPRPVTRPVNRPFIGKTVVITGTLSKPRNEWKTILENVGFQVTSAVSKKNRFSSGGRESGIKAGEI